MKLVILIAAFLTMGGDFAFAAKKTSTLIHKGSIVIQCGYNEGFLIKLDNNLVANIYGTIDMSGKGWKSTFDVDVPVKHGADISDRGVNIRQCNSEHTECEPLKGRVTINTVRENIFEGIISIPDNGDYPFTLIRPANDHLCR